MRRPPHWGEFDFCKGVMVDADLSRERFGTLAEGTGGFLSTDTVSLVGFIEARAVRVLRDG